jgi:hypothetical protein
MRARRPKARSGAILPDGDSGGRDSRAAGDRHRANSEQTLASLPKQVTPDRRHEEIDWGPPVGKEVW